MINYVWYFWIAVFLLYIILLLMNVKAVIPQMVLMHIKEKSATRWRRGILLASVVEIVGSIFMVLYPRYDYKNALFYIFLVLGILFLILGFVLIYYANKRFMDLYGPKENKK